MAGLGLFILGLGQMSITKMNAVILSEITEKSLKEKFLASYLVSHALGVLAVGYIHTVFNDWRPTILYFQVLPNLFFLVLCYFLVQDTPKFILKNNSSEEAAEIFNKIACINGEEARY